MTMNAIPAFALRHNRHPAARPYRTVSAVLVRVGGAVASTALALSVALFALDALTPNAAAMLPVGLCAGGAVACAGVLLQCVRELQR